MVSTKSILCTAALLVAAALPAQAIYRINNPVAGTIWQAGQTVTIGWYDDNSPAVADGTPVTLSLYSNSGSDSNNMDNLQTITSVAGSKGSTTFTVPSTLVNGAGYSVAISYSGGEPRYSHFFTVTGGRADTSSVSASSSDSDSVSVTTKSATSTATATSTSMSTVTSSASRSSVSSSAASSASSKRPASSAASSDDASPTDEDDSTSSASNQTILSLSALSAVAFSLLTRA
ncbi:hypothetical protein IWQ60_003291 [Tieghemiomyces parasiticus]|uniref:Yeast cell wall synthesis Kre9/Knh1-like N-terminal domain-containing protein n=1 Tax=Tieghemiomyces parasiticus TaxID=78921 RepID=A0A9W8E0U6_9FUNG|nr:hypothetical protein IWQ60_003291 [Tieghemiomyces parasiticus]